MTDKKKPGMEKLEAMEREQDERIRKLEQENEARLRDPDVQRGIEAVIRHRIEAESARLSNANAAQIQRLALRLAELDLIDLDDDPEAKVGIAFINNLATGEITVAIDTGDSMYFEQGTQLIEQQERPNGVWFRRLGGDGMPVHDWRKAATVPPSRSSQN